jgi:hypothetical protein
MGRPPPGRGDCDARRDGDRGAASTVTTLVELGRQTAGNRLRRGVLIRLWASHAGAYRMSLRRGPGPNSGLDNAAQCSTFVLMEVRDARDRMQPQLEGAYALCQPLPSGNEIDAALRLPAWSRDAGLRARAELPDLKIGVAACGSRFSLVR